MMEYKGYLGAVEFDDEAGVFHGEVMNTRDVITFQERSAAEFRKAFRDSIEDYLEFCATRGQAPEKPFSGTFSVRLGPELHRKVYVRARGSRKSLNAWVKEALAAAVEENPRQ